MISAPRCVHMAPLSVGTISASHLIDTLLRRAVGVFDASQGVVIGVPVALIVFVTVLSVSSGL